MTHQPEHNSIGLNMCHRPKDQMFEPPTPCVIKLEGKMTMKQYKTKNSKTIILVI